MNSKRETHSGQFKDIVLQNNFQYVEVKFYVKVAVLKSAFIVLYVKEVEFNKNNHTVNPL